MSDDLVQWLGEQFDEDERIAKEAGARSLTWKLVTPLDDAELGDAHWLQPPELKHAERHDPARVLREIDAKRRVLARHCAAPVPPGNEWAEAYPYCAAHAYKEPGGTVVYPIELKNCPELRDLATPYADRPGYREEWRP
ncbi:DUF6221 family protein [Streptomyces venezuelae]|uniref:DUF6221 family protein n=1 Tax=Streptomyces venezuelae TaxID=54571 RepID=UPI00341E73EE